MITIKYQDGLYYCLCDFIEKDIPKRAGFVWDRHNRVWATPFALTAARIAPNNPDVKKGLIQAAEVIAGSNSIYSDFDVPHPKDLEYRPYQKSGVEFMRNRRAILLGDEMGIGKTIQAIGLYNYHCLNGLQDKTPRVLIVCPATIKKNWMREWQKWAIRRQSIGIAEGSHWPKTEIVIINYDVLSRHKVHMDMIVWDLLILDECQYLKNSKAKRTQQICGNFKTRINAVAAKVKLALTGTPIPNRPIELYSLLRYLDPLGWPNKLEFAKRYCNAVPSGFGWDMNGASNLEEMQEKLRSSIMVRRLKKDVLKDLPPKERQIIELVVPQGDEIMKREKRLLKGLADKESLTEDEYREIVRIMRGGDPGAFEEMSTIRRLNAVAKIPAVIEHLHEALDASGKVVCFCHHKEMARALYEAFKDTCVMITGATPVKDRQAAVDKFQTDPNTRLFIGNIIAAGTGITLTAASHVVFAELDWVPGNVTQAEDRCHRIGQKDSVLVQHLVAAGSIDAVMAKVIVSKQKVIERALNQDTDSELERALA